jgi:CheY-like chemotaxis protein
MDTVHPGCGGRLGSVGHRVRDPVGAERRGAMRMLVVESQEPLASIFREGLTAAGCTVEVVADGAAAVERVLAENFDVVIVDVGLPGDAAMGVVRVLQRAMTIAPVLVVSSHEPVRRGLGPTRRCR